MAKFALKSTIVTDPTTGKPTMGIAKTNKRGETIITISAGVPALSESTAVQILRMGNEAAGSTYQAVISLVAENVGALVAELGDKGPDDRKKEVSNRIRDLLKSKGINAEGRGNIVGPYRSIAAAYLAAGGKLEKDGKGELPAEKAIRVSKILSDDEVATGIADAIVTKFESAENAGCLDTVLFKLEAMGYTIECPAAGSDVMAPDAEAANQDHGPHERINAV